MYDLPIKIKGKTIIEYSKISTSIRKINNNWNRERLLLKIFDSKSLDFIYLWVDVELEKDRPMYFLITRNSNRYEWEKIKAVEIDENLEADKNCLYFSFLLDVVNGKDSLYRN
jgi:hypothetical protein